VAERLAAARRRRFVGRAAELELFRSALQTADPPFSLLWVHGPGGVGKTMLLGAMADAARQAGREAVEFDLRALEPSPPAFMNALANALGATGGASPLHELAQREAPVLLLDTFEAAVALEDWLRESFLPALPGGALVAVAGRRAPGDAWRRDPGWAELLRVLSLRNFGPDEARAYLRASGISQALDHRALQLTHGHPLALALLVELLAYGDADDELASFELGAVPDILGRLLFALVDVVPSPRHREALELAAHARFTTEDLMRAALGADDSDELFAWLRELSFVEAGPHGLFPHDLARDVLDSDLRWRDPV